MAVRVLINHESELSADRLTDEQLASLYVVPTTPWLRVNMVATVDGAATGEGGKTGSINNTADKRVFDLLRRLADAVVVGAGTVRAEGYRSFDKPLVVVSRRGAVPPQLLTAPPGSVLLATCDSAQGLEASRDLLGERNVLVTGGSSVDLPALRSRLVDRGLVNLLSEGGPHLLRDMLAAHVVDEVCATVVPRLVAGDHVRMTAGPPVDVPLELRVLLEEDGTLLGRWFPPR